MKCLSNEMLALLNAALRPSLGGFNWGEADLTGVKFLPR